MNEQRTNRERITPTNSERTPKKWQSRPNIPRKNGTAADTPPHRAEAGARERPDQRRPQIKTGKHKRLFGCAGRAGAGRRTAALSPPELRAYPTPLPPGTATFYGLNKGDVFQAQNKIFVFFGGGPSTCKEFKDIRRRS